MTVRIHMVNKEVIELRDEYNPADVWERIKDGQELETQHYGPKIMINPDNVNAVREERSFR